MYGQKYSRMKEAKSEGGVVGRSCIRSPYILESKSYEMASPTEGHFNIVNQVQSTVQKSPADALLDKVLSQLS